MNSASGHEAIEAYRRAVYRTQESPGGRWHALKFDQHPAAVGDDPARLPFAQPWTIITAWNPMSERLTEQQNRAAQVRLVEAVRALGLAFHPAEGMDRLESPSWLEESILVEGLEMKPALQLLKVFRQRAAVYAASGRVGLLFSEPEHWETLPLRIVEAPQPGAR